MDKKKSFLSVSEMVEMALLLCLAIVLDLAGVKIGHAAFNMVPLFILAFRHGFIKSLLMIGCVYSFVNIAFDSWAVNPVSLIFDYVLGYGVISLAGLFSKEIFVKKNKELFKVTYLISVILICSVLRLTFSSISGVILEYAPTFWLAFWLNLSIYVGWDCLLSLVMMLILYPTLKVINKRFPTKNLKI